MDNLHRTSDGFIKDYYRNFDISSFSKRLENTKKKLLTLKTERARKSHYLELYSTYLQLVEIFCINIFATSDKDLFGNIFLGTGEINKKIQQRFFEERNISNEDYIEYILNNFVFNISKDSKDRTQQRRYYKKLIKEAVIDYQKDRYFLNAYKHGFRVFSGEKSSLSIAMTGSHKAFLSQEFSSSVHYYRKDKDTKSVLLCAVNFNWERVFVKSYVLINVLENMKKVFLRSEETIQLLTFVPEIVDSKTGCYRTTQEIQKI